MFPGLWLKAEVAINKENEHKQKKLFRLTKKKKKPPESLACYKEGHLNTTEKRHMSTINFKTLKARNK